jgi:pimeloyl-ACP methyl ester carboxylesterase/class 3 adenylate cyclase
MAVVGDVHKAIGLRASPAIRLADASRDPLRKQPEAPSSYPTGCRVDSIWRVCPGIRHGTVLVRSRLLQPPQTCYARLGDVNVAYQVLGRGPDLIVAPMFASHLDLMWSEPLIERFMNRLASSFRVILFDMPGTGVSDRVSRIPTLDERVAIIRGLLDAVGSERATVVGSSEGGQASALFAATYPERTTALILYSAYPTARMSGDQIAEVLPKISEDATPERAQEAARRIDQLLQRAQEMFEHWGEGRTLDLVAAPPHSQLEHRSWAVLERAAMSRAMAPAAFRALVEFDVTEVLPSIRVPTLVMHPAYDLATPVEVGRYLAAKIPGAKFVETPGAHHGFLYGDAPTVAAEVERFLTGSAHAWDPDRAFGTLLFTDIVGSTQRAVELGDQRWRELLEDHDALVHERVEAKHGRVVQRTGDGFLITFERSTDAVRCAAEICAAAEEGLGVKVRAGVHSGEFELIRDNLAGLAVHIGARVGALARPGEVLVSSTVKDLVVQSGIQFTDRGTHRLKGVPGEWRLFAARANGQPELTQLLPTSRDRASWPDRIAVGLAQRTPAIARSMTRAVRWRLRHSP